MERWFPIETERLLLRDSLSRYDGWGPNTPEITRQVMCKGLAKQREWPREDVTLAVELQKKRKLIGGVRLWVVDRANAAAELGYTFNRSYWNKGYATEAARAVLDASFRTIKLHRVCATCDTRNVASWRVMEKLGMRREGYFLRDKLQKGEWRDSYLYAIRADEWPAS